MTGREIAAETLEALAGHARAVNAKRILEVGTGDGRVTLALAATLTPDGLLITMEPDAAVAATARQHFSTAGFADRISVIIGEPARFLHKIRGPFDVVVRRVPDNDGRLRDRLAAMVRPGGVLIDATRNIV